MRGVAIHLSYTHRTVSSPPQPHISRSNPPQSLRLAAAMLLLVAARLSGARPYPQSTRSERRAQHAHHHAERRAQPAPVPRPPSPKALPSTRPFAQTTRFDAVPSTRQYPTRPRRKPCPARARSCKPPASMPCPARACLFISFVLFSFVYTGSILPFPSGKGLMFY